MSAALFSEDDRSAAFPELTDQQLAVLSRFGEEREYAAGDLVFRQGDSYDFAVILAGRVAVVENLGAENERVVVEHGPRRFLGEYSLIAGGAALMSSVAREQSRVRVVPVDDFKLLIANDPILSELIMSAFLRRRALLIGRRLGPKIIGSRYSPDTRRLREFAARNRLPHVWIDVERDDEVEELLCTFEIAAEEMPVVLIGQHRAAQPDRSGVRARARLRAHAGRSRRLRPARRRRRAGGPRGGGLRRLRGALDAAPRERGDRRPGRHLLADRELPRLSRRASRAAELAARAALQAEKFHARLTFPCEAVSLEDRDGHHLVRLADGDEVLARAVIVATGARYRRLPLDRLETFEGYGVYYAATPAEAQLCTGSAVVVVGGGNSAGQAALYLAESCRCVHLVDSPAAISRRRCRAT